MISEELLAAGETFGVDRATSVRIAEDWRRMMAANFEVLAIELPIDNVEFEASGTCDRVLRLRRRLCFGARVLEPGDVVIGDTKTSSLYLAAGEPGYWTGYPCQLYLYASGLPYCMVERPDGSRREWRCEWPWPPRTDVGLILHADFDGPRGHPYRGLSLWAVDLEHGRDLALLARAAHDAAKRRGVVIAAT